MNNDNKKLPTYIWIAGINLSGLWHKIPIKAVYNSSLHQWYDCSGDFGVNKLGLDSNRRDGYGELLPIITFASTSESEVQIWIDGVLSSFKLLNMWIKC